MERRVEREEQKEIIGMGGIGKEIIQFRWIRSVLPILPYPITSSSSFTLSLSLSCLISYSFLSSMNEWMKHKHQINTTAWRVENVEKDIQKHLYPTARYLPNFSLFFGPNFENSY